MTHSSKLLAALLSLTPVTADAASVTSTWLGGSGNWEDPALWSNGVPQNTPTDSFSVLVDSGASVSSVVALTTSPSIATLTVDSGDSLSVTAPSVLRVNGGTIDNSGRIIVAGGLDAYALDPQPGSYPRAPTSVVGSGSIVLEGGSVFGLNLTNYSAILGYGTIEGAESSRNYGLIEANQSDKLLEVTGNISSFGTLRASNGGRLHIGGGPDFPGLSGSLEAIDGATVTTTDLLGISGVQVTALRGSTIYLTGASESRLVTDSDSRIVVSAGEFPYLTDSELDGNISGYAYLSGTIKNRGSFEGDLYGREAGLTVENAGRISITSEALFESMTLTGSGVVTLPAPSPTAPNLYPRLRGPLSNVDNRILGGGFITGIVSNGGTIEATAETLTVSSPSLAHSGLMAASNGAELLVQATVTGPGSWRADGGTIRITGDVQTTGNVEVLHGGSLAVETRMSAGNLLVEDTGSLDIQGILRVAGDIDVTGTNESLWSFGPGAALETDGKRGAAVGDWSDWQFLEATGIWAFLQPVGGGGTGLYLPKLVIGPDGRLVLRDRRDNGNRPFAEIEETVWVDTLEFGDSLGLLNLNGIHLYYNHLVGSPDQIIDVAVPEPNALALLSLAGALLALRRAEH